MTELVDEGYLVEVTGDRMSIKELIRSSKPDLILLDLYMNGSDRWDVLQDIKKEDHKLPVLIIAAHANYMQDPRMSHTDGYVIKSISLDELKHKITEILEGKTVTSVEGENLTDQPRSHKEVYEL